MYGALYHWTVKENTPWSVRMNSICCFNWLSVIFSMEHYTDLIWYKKYNIFTLQEKGNLRW